MTYGFDDIVNALNQVAPYDWRGFWTARLSTTEPAAPLGGVKASGWRPRARAGALHTTEAGLR